VFWQQFDVAKAIVATNDTSVIPKLLSWLTHEDRHLRGNAGFVFARFGDARGFDVIAAILRDHSERPEGQGIPGGRWSLQGQIRADRYYAEVRRTPNARCTAIPRAGSPRGLPKRHGARE
jgi:HEAT repeat protein